ncbi:MAG: hypothetical protein QW103_01080 [Candidatus Pacearchaeota archaeon]
MKIEILEKKTNDLLNREEILVKIENKVCPKKEEIIQAIGLNPETAVVEKVFSSFGSKIFKAEILNYKTKEDKNRIEKLPAKVRKKMLEEAKKQKENKSLAGN